MSVPLGGKAIIPVTVCGNPAGKLYYKWSHEQTEKTIALSNSIGINKYQATIVTNELTKKHCGRVLSFYPKNKFGKSTNDRSTTIAVSCKCYIYYW